MKTNFKRLASMMLVMAMMVGMFALVVSADVAYDSEKEKITGLTEGDFYALKYDGAKFASAKWFPVSGTDLDIAKLIPKDSTKKYVIGILSAADYKGAETDKTKVNPVTIPGRGKAPEKDKNKYDETTKAIVLADGTEWRLGISSTWKGKAAFTSEYFAKADNFPFGAVMEVRTAADTDKELAASLKVLKIKIAAQPKAPNVTWDESKGVMKGWKADKMEISEDGVAFAPVPTLTTKEAWAAYAGKTVYIRTVAAGKKPYSVAKSVDIPAATTTPDPDPEP